MAKRGRRKYLDKFLLWLSGESEKSLHQDLQLQKGRIAARAKARLSAKYEAGGSVELSTSRDYEDWMNLDEE